MVVEVVCLSNEAEDQSAEVLHFICRASKAQILIVNHWA